MIKLSYPARRKEEFALLLSLVFFLVVYLLTASNYGAGFDEFMLYEYAEDNLNAYHSAAYGDPTASFFQFEYFRYYGPAYLILGGIGVRGIQALLPAIARLEAWHLINLVVFLLGAWLLFHLCARLAAKKAALFAALLYLTQPLLWGQGIINPKDGPFMVAFMAAVWAGLRLLDQFSTGLPPAQDLVRKKLFALSPFSGRRILFAVVGLILLLLFLVDRFCDHPFSRLLISLWLDLASMGAPLPFLGSLSARLSDPANPIPLDLYLAKALRLISMGESRFLFGVGLAGLLVFLWRAGSQSRWCMLAGVIAGLAVSVRVLGPAAVGLVLGVAVLKKVRTPPACVALYGSSALLTALLFWPYLWDDPLSRFWQSVRLMADFPWNGAVRFEGMDFLAGQTPWYYLPKLLLIQFTLPLWILALAGIGLVLLGRSGRRLPAPETWMHLFWFFIPLVLAVVFRPKMYDNFRQFLFIVPPLFVLASLAFDRFINGFQNKKIGLLMSIALLIPGIFARAWLFPYEYIYYNALVGWTGQVGRSYETDYWGTSFCEAGRFLDNAAQPGSRIAFLNPIHADILNSCAAHNYDILIERAEFSANAPEYSVVLTRNDDDLDYFRDLPIIKTIGRGGTVFSVIRKAP
jgi:4-amino-4-deoxy-L-arabinose transferase-like glycosyltransferase